MSWGWRTKPRSVVKTVQWFKYFSKLENKNWEEKLEQLDIRGKAIHPIRREYVYNAHKDEDENLAQMSYEDYVSGMFDITETESNARNDKATFEFFGFGYVDKDGIIQSTEVGKLIENDRFDSEDFIKQLLKMHFPSKATDIGRNIPDGKVIFPFEIILKIIDKFKYVNRYEMGFIFGCNSIEEIDTLYNAIEKFREKYNALQNKTDRTKCESIFKDIYKDNYGIEPNVNTLCGDYGDAINRSLLYTGLFDLSGRGNYTKVRVAEHARKKVELLINKYKFQKVDEDNIEDYMKWYGSSHNITLPWENKDERKELIYEKIYLLQNKIEEYKKQYAFTIDKNIKEYIIRVEKTDKKTELKLIEKELIDDITSLNEEVFIKYISKKEQTRKEILDKFEDIITGNEDMAALWLECNTWKSLVAIDGEKEVKRNFTIEEDLSPRFFAPGKGNTPDIELYKDKYVIVPEVSLMTGVLQWEHEASSVIDHVLNIMKKYKSIYVIGLFISSRINVRTMWQFFILNKQSWMGTPVPVIPLTIEQYMKVLKYTYNNNLAIDELNNLLNYIHKEAIKCNSYDQWDKNMETYIENWKQKVIG